MRKDASDRSYEIIGVEDAEARFGVSRDVDYPYADFNDEQPIRLYSGGLRITGDCVPELPEPADWIPYNVIIDGDLVVDGAVDWWDYAMGNFVLVTGDLRARNVLLQGCTSFVVRGDLVVDNGVQGHHGDDGGLLEVYGQTTAQCIVNTLYFNMIFGSAPRAIVIGDEHRTGCAVDFDDEEIDDIVDFALLDDDGRADERKIKKALAAGRPILRTGVKPARVATAEELDALLAERPETVTELDLSARKLRAFPEQLYRFPHLRKLSLADNDVGPLPDRIGELAALEELDLSEMELEELPASIGRLSRLRVLQVSGNRRLTLPAAIGELTTLETLRAERIRLPLPASLERLDALTELHLRGVGAAGNQYGVVDFPDVISRLPRLRILDLSDVVLSEVPERLLELRELEELVLDTSLGNVSRLPDLSRLPRLRVLRMDGRRSWTDGPCPGHHLLDGVWAVGTLEELSIDRWGGEGNAGEAASRPPLTGLPGDAFALMPGLRRLDLSFNDLRTLPESFFALRHLEAVDLRYTKLDAATLDRIRTTFPDGVRFDLRNVTTRDDVDDPGWRRINELVKDGSTRLTRDSRGALDAFQQALALCLPGARYSDYDRLYALYGVVEALSHLKNQAEATEREELIDQLVKYAEEAQAAVPAGEIIWHYTDVGAFQEEVVRRTGNALAWQLMERGELERALGVIDRAVGLGAEPAYDFIRDTKVRILLKMGRADEAYLIVDQVLTRDPDFDDFQDLRRSDDFLRWRRKR